MTPTVDTTATFRISTATPHGFDSAVRVVELSGRTVNVESVVRHAMESLLRHLMTDGGVQHIILDLSGLANGKDDLCLGPLLRRATPGADQKKWILLVDASGILADWLREHGLGDRRLPVFRQLDDALEFLRERVAETGTRLFQREAEPEPESGAIADDPRLKPAADAVRRGNNADFAIQVLNTQVLKMQPDHAAANRLYYEAVRAKYKRVGSLPAPAASQTRVLQALQEAGSWEQLAESARVHYADDPANGTVLELIAEANINLGRYHAALAALVQLTEGGVDPRSVTGWFWKARCLDQLGDLDGAIKALDRARAIRRTKEVDDFYKSLTAKKAFEANKDKRGVLEVAGGDFLASISTGTRGGRLSEATEAQPEPDAEKPREHEERGRGITIRSSDDEVNRKLVEFKKAREVAEKRTEAEKKAQKRAEESARATAEVQRAFEEASRSHRVRHQYDKAESPPAEEPPPPPPPPPADGSKSPPVMKIPAQDAMDLRKATGLPVSQAKQVLKEADGDKDRAKSTARRASSAKKLDISDKFAFDFEGGEAIEEEAREESINEIAAKSFNGGGDADHDEEDTEYDDDLLLVADSSLASVRSDASGEEADGLDMTALNQEAALIMGQQRSLGMGGSGFFDAKPKPRPQPKQELVEVIRKMATVRYFSQMNPDRVFPLTVKFTKEKMQEWVTKAVAQVSGDKHIEVTADDPFVTVRPRFAGCHVVPAESVADLSLEETTAAFSVSPFAQGQLDEACVEILYRGEVVQTIKTPTRITTQAMSRATATLSFLSPIYFMGLKAAGMDLQSQAESGFPLFAQITQTVGGLTNLGIICGVALAGLAGLFYLWKKPKKSDPLHIFYNGPGG